jgi:hypothetical protein
MDSKNIAVGIALACLALSGIYFSVRESLWIAKDSVDETNALGAARRTNDGLQRQLEGSQSDWQSEAAFPKSKVGHDIEVISTDRGDSRRQSSSTKLQGESNQEASRFTPLDSIAPQEVVSPILDESRVGRHFVVSPSAQPNCIPEVESSDCDDQEELDSFAQEPRDLAWAPHVEDLIRTAIAQRNPTFSIRNLECRLVTCVLEVESLDGLLNPRRNLQPEDWRGGKVKPSFYRIGLERNELGRRRTVTLWVYERIR